MNLFMFDKATPDQWGEAAGLLAAASLSAGFTRSIMCGVATYLVGWVVAVLARHAAIRSKRVS